MACLSSIIILLLVNCKTDDDDNPVISTSPEPNLTISGESEIVGLNRQLELTVEFTNENGEKEENIFIEWIIENNDVLKYSNGGIYSNNFGISNLIAINQKYSDTIAITVVPDPTQKFRIELANKTVTGGRVINRLHPQIVDNENSVIRQLDASDVTWDVKESSFFVLKNDGSLIGLEPGQDDVIFSYDSMSGYQTLDIVQPSRPGDFFISAYDGTTLRVHLLLPPNPTNNPGVVITHGSGPGGVIGYSLASQFLPSNGYATLLYDKRGYGLSGGNDSPPLLSGYPSYFDRLSDDQLACFDFLSSHASVDSAKLGFIGYSQSGWLNPLAASKSSRVKFFVNIVGPTVSLGQEVYYSALTGGANCGNKTSSMSDEEIMQAYAEYNGEHYFDPIDILLDLEIPAFWVLGSKDYSIPVFDVIKDIDSLRSLGKDYSYNVIDRANHCLRDFENGNQYPHWTTSNGIIPWIDARFK